MPTDRDIPRIGRKPGGIAARHRELHTGDPDFEGVTLQLLNIPTSNDGFDLAQSLESFSLGALKAMRENNSLSQVESSKINIGEDKTPAICWHGSVVAGGETGVLYACAAIKERPDHSMLANLVFSAMPPADWADDQAAIADGIQGVTSAFFLAHELED